jgi:hypothetical protein
MGGWTCKQWAQLQQREPCSVVCAWRGDELHTRQVAPAVRAHPVTGERAAAGELIPARSRTVAFAQRRDLVHGVPGERLPAEPQLRLRRH